MSSALSSQYRYFYDIKEARIMSPTSCYNQGGGGDFVKIQLQFTSLSHQRKKDRIIVNNSIV